MRSPTLGCPCQSIFAWNANSAKKKTGFPRNKNAVAGAHGGRRAAAFRGLRPAARSPPARKQWRCRTLGRGKPRKSGGLMSSSRGFPVSRFRPPGREGGFDDPRAGVLDEILRIMELVRPRAFVLENVKAAKQIRAQLAAKIGHFPTAWNSMQYRRAVAVAGLLHAAAQPPRGWECRK